MEVIIIENIHTGHWFFGNKYCLYDLPESSWGSSSIMFSTEEEYNQYLSRLDYTKIIETPLLPLDQEWLGLRGTLLHHIPKIENYSEYRKKIELILKDRQITGKSFVEAKKTVEEFLANPSKY
jgi:hypothetical protein